MSVPVLFSCMRRPYLTDLSDAEWTYLKDHFPTPKQQADHGYIPCARSLAPSFTSSRAAGYYERVVRLRGDESLDGEAFGSLMRLSDSLRLAFSETTQEAHRH
jgi:hypothetical protein